MQLNKQFFYDLRKKAGDIYNAFVQIPEACFISEGRLTARYSNNHAMYCGSLLRHIDENRCLFQPLCKSANEMGKEADYTTYLFDQAGHLVRSKSDISESSRYETCYITHGPLKYAPTYIITKEKASLFACEISNYDTQGRLISFEALTNTLAPPSQMCINAEYYEYDGQLMQAAVKVRDYLPDFSSVRTSQNHLLRPGAPLPEVYTYTFLYQEQNNAHTCEKRLYFSYEDYDQTFIKLNPDELQNLPKYGIVCFGA